MRNCFVLFCVSALTCGVAFSEESIKVLSVSASDNTAEAKKACDGDFQTRWDTAGPQQPGQWIHFVLNKAADINSVYLNCEQSAGDYPRGYEVYVTVDPMNWGKPVAVGKGTSAELEIEFAPKYGSHIKVVQTDDSTDLYWSIHEVDFDFSSNDAEFDAVEDDIADRAYMDSSLPVEVRIDNLMTYLTVEDKMRLLQENWGIPGIPRLKVPRVNKVEAIHGFSYTNGGATIFPQCIGQAATWNKNLIRDVASAIGEETKAAGVQQCWSPVLDVARDQRWGRCEETFGEDPYLVTEIGCAWIEGFQSHGLITTPKHFAGHGAPLGGRDSHDIGLSERVMRETHLPPFRAAFKRCGAESVMVNYSTWLDTVSAASPYLLKGILREEWGFDGFVVSDCGALRNMTSRKHYIVKDCGEAAALAMKVGVATNCGDVYNCEEALKAAESGVIPEEDIDFTVKTLLRVMFRHGLFENPPGSFDWDTQYEGWNSPEHRKLALECARESMTLLKNEDDLLPLNKDIDSVAVIGPNADEVQLGDYSPGYLPGQLTSVLDGVKESVSEDTNVYYAEGCDHTKIDKSGFAEAVKAAQKSDVAIVVLGDRSGGVGEEKNTSGENHDKAELIFPGVQQELLKAVTESGTPVVLVVVSGRPYTLEYSVENNPAILMAWLAGQESGKAAADVLFGDYNPAGRLPVTLPRSTAQLPLYYNFKTSGRRYEYADMEFYPRYRFGYGLSYTSFEYSNLETRGKSGGGFVVTADVKNTGEIAGDEVVQLYITDMYASVRTPVMQLKGFERIHLKPGQKKTVRFTLSPYDISLLNDKMDRVVEPGRFRVFVGGLSPSYSAGDHIKDSVGYENSAKGVNGDFNVSRKYAADFSITPADEPVNGKLTAVVTNEGNLTDTGEVKLYADGEYTGKNRRYELAPGKSKEIVFDIDSLENGAEVSLVGKYTQISNTVNTEQ